MKLVSFPNNTAGGLICDLLNNKNINFIDYRVQSKEHNIFKVGDTPTILLNIDDDLQKYWSDISSKHKNDDLWFGTHLHPSAINNIEDFDKIICITTKNLNSKLYRWIRYYNGWFKNNHLDWQEDNSLEKIDKIRELAKNNFVEFLPHSLCENIEFESIIDSSFVKKLNLNNDYYQEWRNKNSWLYDKNINDRWEVKRFFEAKFEIENGIPFKYF